MKTLANLSPAKGSNTRKKRLGRGVGSNWGKTAGKGHKGQLARKGPKLGATFEGGQTPLYRRTPKRGFANIFRVKYNPINLELLNKHFKAGETVTKEALNKLGLIRWPNLPVKVLGRGTLEKKLTLSVDAISGTAREAVAKAGGVVEEKK